MAFYLCFLSGIVSGILGGMGMGGGTLLIPVLSLVFSVEQQIAQSSNLISFLPMSLFSLKIHYSNGLIKFKDTAYIIIPAVLSCVIFSVLAVNAEGEILKRAFGIFLCALSLFSFYGAFNQFTRRKK